MNNRTDRGQQINWNQVYYFSEIATTGSIKAAAERLGLSSSTLSEHLSQLEADLSLKLFHRQHRKLQLTDEGARLFQHAKQMFEAGNRFIDVISPIPLGHYPLSIGLVAGASYASAYKLVATFTSQYPDASMRLSHYRHDELEQALIEARLDFGFTDRPTDRRNLKQTRIESSELRFYVADRLGRHDLAGLLQSLPLLVCRSDYGVPSAVEKALESMDIVPRSMITSEFPSLIEDLCRRGAGVAALAQVHFTADGGVTDVPLPANFPTFPERLFATWSVDAENSDAVVKLKALLSASL